MEKQEPERQPSPAGRPGVGTAGSVLPELAHEPQGFRWGLPTRPKAQAEGKHLGMFTAVPCPRLLTQAEPVL